MDVRPKAARIEICDFLYVLVTLFSSLHTFCTMLKLVSNVTIRFQDMTVVSYKKRRSRLSFKRRSISASLPPQATRVSGVW